MTTKKIVVIVVSIVVVLGSIVVLFVGGIIGVVFYGMSNSDAAHVAKDFLSNNERLKQDIGDVKDFGSFITGNINLNNGDGTAQLNLKVIGERKQVNAAVELVYRSGHQWRVTAASYKNEAGEMIDLLNPYESRKFILNPALVAPSVYAHGQDSQDLHVRRRDLNHFVNRVNPVSVLWSCLT